MRIYAFVIHLPVSISSNLNANIGILTHIHMNPNACNYTGELFIGVTHLHSNRFTHIPPTYLRADIGTHIHNSDLANAYIHAGLIYEV